MLNILKYMIRKFEWLSYRRAFVCGDKWLCKRVCIPIRACFRANIRKLYGFEGRPRLLVLLSKIKTNLCQTLFLCTDEVCELTDDGVLLDMSFTVISIFRSP